MEKVYTIDATGKKLGRVATDAALVLMGKKSASFRRNAAGDVAVAITNASKADFREKKMRATTYATYTGYPGGLKMPSMKQIALQKGYSELFRLAVKNMLPANKLRGNRLKRLNITE